MHSAIAIDENNPTQDATIIDPRLAMRSGKEGFEALNLRRRQPVKVAHLDAPVSEQ